MRVKATMIERVCEQCGAAFRVREKMLRHQPARWCSRKCYYDAAHHEGSMAEWFWSRVDKSGDCWVWRGRCLQSGYGQLIVKKKVLLAHRVAFELTHGHIPPGLEICHRCDNPPCVNPAHLFCGSHADNMRDMKTKGRQSRGARPYRDGHRNAKLNADSVREIRSLHQQGMSFVELGRRYGVSGDQASNVVKRRSWRDVV